MIGISVVANRFDAGFLTCLISAVALGVASGQTPPRKPLRTEPLEKYDMPPAYIYRLEPGPRMISQYGSFTSFQVNVDVNGQNILGDAANEPSIAVDPTNGNKMAIGWRQFNTVNSNFRQGGWGYTTDGGTTWTFPGVLENNVFRSDPVLNSDETGTVFYLSLLQSFCDNIWRSTNGGQSWTELQGDGAAGGGDKEWFTIDKTSGMGHGFQYQAWSTAAACDFGQFSRSTDGGISWESPLSIPNSVVWGTLDVDTNGNLFVAGAADSTSPFYCLRSSNAQNPNVTPTFDRVTQVNLGGSLDSGEPINPEGLVGQVFLAVDRSGTSTNNNVYMLASVQPIGFTTGSDVMFVRSTDGGQTFSTPRRINDDPVNQAKWHWFGTLSVAPNGRIDAVWLDTRNAANNTDSQLFYSYSFDGGNTWSLNVAISNSFNPFEGYPQQNKIGDYITIVSDNTGGNVAYAATFNFNPNTGQHEEDVYYVRVSAHPTFFNGEIALGGGFYYLQFANGTPFGYYSYLPDQNFIYHIDLGFEYFFDANDANHGIYFYDFASSSFFYTSPTLFPDLYDFGLNAWLYYLPDANNPGRYTHNPRWFYNFTTGQWITL